MGVTVLPGSPESLDNPWLYTLTRRRVGCSITQPCPPDRLPQWLRDRLVVDFCVRRCVQAWPEMARRGCRLTHVPCMNFVQEHEAAAFSKTPPTAVVFQSEYQRQCLGRHYTAFGVPPERKVSIHGAFDPSPFFLPSCPRTSTGPFVVGRLARPDAAKWPERLWSILEAARARTPLEADMMGWTPEMGQRPRWVRCWPPASWPTPHYLAKLHALLCIGDCPENWSRVVLEAFAAGVPVIADRRGGYLEQIVDGETGLLVDGVDDAAEAIVRLATDEPFRQRLITQAHDSLSRLANPDAIGAAWLQLLGAIGGM